MYKKECKENGVVVAQKKEEKPVFKKLYETKKKAVEDYSQINPTKDFDVALYQLNVIGGYYDYMIFTQKHYIGLDF